MSRVPTVLLLLLLGTGLGGVRALLGEPAGGEALAPPAGVRSSGGAEAAPVARRPVERETAAGLVARPDAGEPDREPRFETAPTERAGDRATEAQLHRAFLARDPAELALVAEDLLRGATRAPEQVALLRALLDRPSSATEELFLCALRDLPHDARPGGESVPSTALLLLDRRAARDPLARGILRRAAFERPHAPGELRHRAAASFLPHADEEELLACRTELTREPDARFLECALEALSRNPHAEVAAILLAPHGREPVSGAGERTESP